jgi:hypothetical protein
MGFVFKDFGVVLVLCSKKNHHEVFKTTRQHINTTKATTSDDREIAVVLGGWSMIVSKPCSSSTPYRAFSFYYDWIGEMIGDGDVSSGLFINGLVALH